MYNVKSETIISCGLSTGYRLEWFILFYRRHVAIIFLYMGKTDPVEKKGFKKMGRFMILLLEEGFLER